MAEERIQKIMAEQGLCSRRAAEQIIAEGRVKVNGHPVKVGDKMDPNRDVLHVDDERIYIRKDQQMYYLALYKPRGYVTTASDELGRKTVMELVSDIPARLYPVGRLDKDSEGLLLMTNDGAFAQAVTHPSGGISKLYRVTVQPRADESQILKLSSGVVLDDGTKTMPCAINVVTDEPGRTVMEMTLKEGKNREIRRMCETVGLEVVRLKRNAEGVVKLGMLKPGTYRELTKAEVTKADLEPLLFRDVLGSTTTYYNGGQAGRTTNVRLACNSIDGTILNPGEEFSYNDIVGERTASRGFRSAIIFSNGSEVDGLGGGVCQVSSTVYMAVLRADLKVTERYNHQFQISYTPISQDAAVYWGSKDFKFVNDTPYPIKVVASSGGGTLTVKLYGTKTSDKTISFSSKSYTSGKYKYASLYKTVTENGTSTTTKVNTSKYLLQ